MNLHARDAVIVDGPNADGSFKRRCVSHVRAEELSAILINSLFERNPGLDPAEVEDVVWGVNDLEQAGMLPAMRHLYQCCLVQLRQTVIVYVLIDVGTSHIASAIQSTRRSVHRGWC